MKILKKIALCALAVFVAVSFCGCDVDYRQYAGEYKLTLMIDIHGETQTVSKLEELNVIDEGSTQSITLDADKTFNSVGILGDESGAFYIEDDAIVFSFSKGKIVANISNKKKIVITKDNQTFVFEKVGE